MRPIPVDSLIQFLELEDGAMAGDNEGSQADDVDLGAFVRMVRAKEEVDAAITVALVDADGDFAVFEFTVMSERGELRKGLVGVGDWYIEMD